MGFDWGALANYSAVITLVITAITVIVASRIGISQLRKLTEQQKLGVFMNYTGRYSKIVESLPGEASERDTELGVLIGLEPQVMASMRQFFDLCSEEYFLHARGLIDQDVWVVWEKGMNYHMSRKGYREAWALVRDEGYDDEFKKFIDSLSQKTTA